jgi:hypothetical protein
LPWTVLRLSRLEGRLSVRDCCKTKQWPRRRCAQARKKAIVRSVNPTINALPGACQTVGQSASDFSSKQGRTSWRQGERRPLLVAKMVLRPDGALATAGSIPGSLIAFPAATTAVVAACTFTAPAGMFLSVDSDQPPKGSISSRRTALVNVSVAPEKFGQRTVPCCSRQHWVQPQ